MTNERLINSVSVGLVFVRGQSENGISDTEKAFVLAEVQEGLEALRAHEPSANISWKYTVLDASIDDITPWKGANWKGLPESFYKGIDAALWRDFNKKIYFFKGDSYVRITPDSFTMDPGYPQPIAGNWKGLPAEFNGGIDAAIWRKNNNKIYFFKGSQYVRINPANTTMDPGYPKPIAGNWKGLPADFNSGIDASVWRESNGKIYFFKGSQYVRIDPTNTTADPGYPRTIEGNWKSLPAEFAEMIHAAMYLPTNNKIYFFKNGFTVGEYARINPEDATMDSDYPKPIGLSKEDAEALWRDPALTKLGYPTGFEGVQVLVEDIRGNAQNAYCAFFTKFPTVHFAYAKAKYKRLVFRWAVTPATPSFENWLGLDRVFAHETGHIFGASDEYDASNCECDSTQGNFIKISNGNCYPCANPGVDCLMKNNAPVICDFTRTAIGWTALLGKIDAALYTPDKDRIYLFSNQYYTRLLDVGSSLVTDDGYPQPVEGNWKGLPAEFNAGIDEAIWRGFNKKIYFFKGSQYVRIDPPSRQMDPGYPQPIAGNWKGLPAEFNAGIDAAIYPRTIYKIYFFKGSQYVRINPANTTMDPGYPKPIAGNWKGLPADFNSGIDASVWRESNGKIYFFKDKRYVRISTESRTMDAGYPRWISGNWMPFPKS